MDDLCSRFIINIPEGERHDLIRVFFQIELAHWFYLDFYCQGNPDLKGCGIKDFSALIFQHCPTLTDHASNVDKILESWREYKMAVPTYGAIMLDPTLKQCLLVQGYWAKASWGFPKGKVNEEESCEECAIREVLEETGFDIRPLIDPQAFIEYRMNEQLNRLYIVPGISMETEFEPRTRNEIKHLQWFRLDWLPANKKDTVCKQQYGLNPNSFFMVIPFVKSLRKWIAKKQGKSDNLQAESDSNPAKSAKLSKGRDAKESEGKPLTEKQRQKQQSQFAQQMQNEFFEYLQHKDALVTGPPPSTARLKSAGREQKGKSSSPPHFPKTPGGKSYTATSKLSTSGAKNQVQILKRDGTMSGSTRRSLSGQFTDANISPDGAQVLQPLGQDGFFSTTWANFSLDTNAVMAAMFPVIPPIFSLPPPHFVGVTSTH
ncbi:m7GpppN-mRNA hydrolase [Lamellibrachia satsuma]|nr:m7GpppN-mRNA hydrolase [Lamellibrachia satsuma]